MSNENRPTVLLLIGIVLAAYGIYAAVHLPAMLIGRPEPLLVLGFLLQTTFALAAAVAVWRRLSWAGLSVILLGASITATVLVEAFVLGIVAYLWALLVAVVAIVTALVVAAYLGSGSGRREFSAA
jgi:hypothetical protein